ncbi:MAG: aldehyde ferredoxin oxidoreductase family protein [Candidatus Saliniplasma sp.]
MSGFWRELLRINLSNREKSTEELSEDFRRKYVGGAGIASRLLYDEVEKGTNPLGPDNKLIMVPGLLLGPALPRASKTTFTFKSPLTEGYGKAIVGGWIGDRLKKAGYDALVIEGKAEEPSILVIKDGEISIENASDLWGKDTHETGDILKDRYEGVKTAVIGPAGEKLSKISIIECDDRQAARGGPGAVMGSKNLKGIAIAGNKNYPLHDEEKLNELKSKWRKETVEKGESYVKWGTGGHLHAMNVELGAFPVRNWQTNYFKKAYDKLDDPEAGRIDIDPRKWVEKYQDGKRPCPYCPAPCSQYFVAEDTPYGDIAIDGPEYETQYSLGGCTEIDDVEAVTKANEICDKLGIDTISAGATISWAMEAYEKGLLETDIDLKFGNPEAMIEAVRRMGKRESELGELLTDGVKEAARKLGKGSEEFAIHVKGMEPAGYEVRGMFGMGLAFSVAPRGADHLTSSEYVLEFGGSFWNFEGYDRYDIESKGLPVKMMEDLMMVYDMTGACKFSRDIYRYKGFLELIEAVTGWDMNITELLIAGERGHNVAKVFNVREGFDRSDDVLPERVMTEEIPNGPSEGKRIPRRELEKALDRYYDARGWNLEGIPTKSKLESLNLPEIAEEIGALKD